MMLEVDETFTMIWLSRSSEVRVKVRKGNDLSPLSGLFLCMWPVAGARSSSGGVAIRYVLPVLWMLFFILRTPMAAWRYNTHHQPRYSVCTL